MAGGKRSNFGHIQHMAEGKYRIYWDAPVGEDGKRARKSKVVRGTRDDAEIELARHRIGAAGLSRTASWRTFWNAEVVPSFARDGLAAKTEAEYERLWKRELLERIGDDRVCDTDYDRVCEVVGEIESPTVQRAVLRLWKKICNMAVRKKMLAANPVDRSIKIKPHKKRKKHAIAAEEFIARLQKMMGTRYWRLAVLLCVGGLRLEEAAPLLGSDVRERRYRGRRYAVVSIERAMPTVRGKKVLKGTKTEESVREQWFAEPFASLLLDSIDGDGPLFPGPRPQARSAAMDETWFASPNRLRDNYGDWCARNKVPYVRPGDMRTIYSRWQAEAGSPDSLVCASMGHSDGTTRGDNYMGDMTPRSHAMIAENLAALLTEECPCRALIDGDLVL
ncbi:MAG: hypothetical protein HFJ72_08605 [Adlercreutzia sp.]|nr:hypothetical protein [Adlercreutzia sp.]